MTKKVPKKILRIERHFFVNLRKKCFWPPAPPPIFCTGGAPLPPTEIDRRAAADTMTSEHSSSMYVCMHACMYVCRLCRAYVCMHSACLHVCMYVCMFVCMHVAL